jgi:glycosyltransferase involved in cell wall biosynthesis
MNIIFLGGIRSTSIEKIEDMNAAEKLQYNLLKGLSANNKVFFLNLPFSQSSKNKKSKYKFLNGIETVEINVLNIKILNHFLKIKSITREIKKNVNSKIEYKIFIYSAYFPFIWALYSSKKRFSNLQVTMYVPDLPGFMAMGKPNLYHSISQKISEVIVYQKIKCVDKFIQITENMNSKINIYNKKSLIIDGMIDHKLIINNKNNNNEKIVFTHAGSLQKKYGIDILLEAFKLFNNKRYELNICGSGDMDETIKKNAKNQLNIKFHGLLNRTELENIYERTDVLVNPRTNSNEFTKYSFPSKIIEYLFIGVPVISFKLAGFSPIYDSLIIYAEHENSQCLAKKMFEVGNLDYQIRKKIGEANRKFIIENKSIYIQTKKIESFLEEEG